MLPRELIILILIAIVASLGWAGYYLVREKDAGNPRRTVWALTVRIGLSVALFAFLMLGAWLGWFEPPPPPDFTR